MTQRSGPFFSKVIIKKDIIEYQDFNLDVVEIKPFTNQVNTAKAEAEMAYQLQASKVNARIKEEEMQVQM